LIHRLAGLAFARDLSAHACARRHGRRRASQTNGASNHPVTGIPLLALRLAAIPQRTVKTWLACLVGSAITA
jgi:hypothetical protein